MLNITESTSWQLCVRPGTDLEILQNENHTERLIAKVGYKTARTTMKYRIFEQTVKSSLQNAEEVADIAHGVERCQTQRKKQKTFVLVVFSLASLWPAPPWQHGWEQTFYLLFHYTCIANCLATKIKS